MAIEVRDRSEDAPKTVKLNSPITHDGKEYGRGEHSLPPALADKFLSLRDASTKRAIAELPKPAAPVKGTVTDAPKR